MDEFIPAISKLEEKLQAQLADAAETKRAINLLLKMSGKRQKYRVPGGFESRRGNVSGSSDSS